MRPQLHRNVHIPLTFRSGMTSQWWSTNACSHIGSLAHNTCIVSPQHLCYAPGMSWKAQTTDEFRDWFGDLGTEQEEVVAAVEALQVKGPTQGRPLVDTLEGSKIANLKELRVSRTMRVFFAFDPRQIAVLLIGGDKAGKTKRFYKQMLPRAERIYKQHLSNLKEEGQPHARTEGFHRAKHRGT